MTANLWRNKYVPYAMIAIVIIGVGYLYYRKKSKEQEFDLLMTAVNDKSTATGTVDDLKDNSAFNENYWRTFGADFAKRNSFGGKEGNIAKRIYDAKGTFSDNEKDVVSLFSTFKSKSQVSYIAWQFNTLYKKKLIDYLNSFMDNSVLGHGGTNYMLQINDIVNRLPNN